MTIVNTGNLQLDGEHATVTRVIEDRTTAMITFQVMLSAPKGMLDIKAKNLLDGLQ